MIAPQSRPRPRSDDGAWPSSRDGGATRGSAARASEGRIDPAGFGVGCGAVSPARALAVLSALVLVTGCPRKQEAPPAPAQDAGPAQRAEVEPNDRPEQSMAVGESTDVTASLSSTPARADEDWYLLFGDRPARST